MQLTLSTGIHKWEGEDKQNIQSWKNTTKFNQMQCKRPTEQTLVSHIFTNTFYLCLAAPTKVHQHTVCFGWDAI